MSEDNRKVRTFHISNELYIQSLCTIHYIMHMPINVTAIDNKRCWSLYTWTGLGHVSIHAVILCY